MEMNLMPGFSLVVLVLAACASLTSVQSQKTGEPANSARVSDSKDKVNKLDWWGWELVKEERDSTARADGAKPDGAAGSCATRRRNCMNLQLSSMEALNRQVNLELSAFYSYTAMASFFKSTDGAMRGTAAFFRGQASEELAHANMFMEYIISRGGDLNLNDIRTPNVTSFNGINHAMEHALEMEIHVTDALLNLHDVAAAAGDKSLEDFLDSNFIAEQVDSMDQLAHYVAILERFDGDPVGAYMFDEALYKDMTV